MSEPLPVSIEDDKINPVHYRQGGMEAIDVMNAFSSQEEFIGYLRCNCIKYLLRMNHKDTPSVNVRRYLDRLYQEVAEWCTNPVSQRHWTICLIVFRWIHLASGLSYKTDIKRMKTGMRAGSLKPGGYWTYTWRKDGRLTSRSCHTLVAELSGQLCPGPGYEVDHKDRDKNNNTIENLRWVTHSEQNCNRKSRSAVGFRWVKKVASGYAFQFKVPGKGGRKNGFTTAAEAYAAAVRMRRAAGIDGQKVSRAKGASKSDVSVGSHAFVSWPSAAVLVVVAHLLVAIPR